MDYVYYCTRCGHVGTLESQNPYDDVLCSQCNATLFYTGCSKEVWDCKTEAEQEEIKSRLSPINIPSPQISLTEQIAADIHTIKNILIFFTVIWGISIFITLVASCSR